MLRIAVLAGAFLVVATLAAEAQGVVWDRWHARCKTDAMTDQRGCQVAFSKRLPKGFLDISIARADGNYALLISADRDLGLIDGCALRVESNDHYESRTTVRNICVMLHSKIDTANAVAEMKAGRQMLLRIYFYSRGYKDYTIPLAGLTAALQEAGL